MKKKLYSKAYVSKKKVYKWSVWFDGSYWKIWIELTLSICIGYLRLSVPMYYRCINRFIAIAFESPWYLINSYKADGM